MPGAAKAVPLAFTSDQVFIPVAVGAAFALPALLALAYVLVVGFLRRYGAVLGAVALTAMAAAIVGYLQPGLLPGLIGRG